MSREIIFEALNGVRDEYINEVGAKLGLVAVGAATVGAAAAGAAGTSPETSALFSLSPVEPAAKAGFGAWLAKGGWIALAAGILVAAGVAVGAFFFGKSGDTPPAGSGEVTIEDTEKKSDESTGNTEMPTTEDMSDESAGDTETTTEDTAEPEALRYFQFPLTDPDDTVSYVSLPDLSAEGYPKLAFFTPVGEGDALKEVFALPVSTEGEQNILVMLCEGILDPSYQTGSHYVMIYFIENTFVKEVDGTEQRTVQMQCGQIDFFDAPMSVPSGGTVSYVDYNSNKSGSAVVTYSEANRSSVLARTRHDNLLALDSAEELLYEYGKENYKLSVLYSNIDGVEIINTPVESLPDFPYELFRTHALP